MARSRNVAIPCGFYRAGRGWSQDQFPIAIIRASSIRAGNHAMRLATLQSDRGPRAVVRAGERYIDIAATDSALPTTIRGLLEAGSTVLAAVRRAAEHPKARSGSARQA